MIFKKIEKLVEAISRVDLNKVRLESEVFTCGDQSDVYVAHLASYVDAPIGPDNHNYFNRFHLVHSKVFERDNPITSTGEWNIVLDSGNVLHSDKFPQHFKEHVDAFVNSRKFAINERDYTNGWDESVFNWCQYE